MNMGNTILIADDNPATLHMLEMYFNEAGFTIYAAESCKDAIRQASRHLPDCFLLDYHLGDDTAAPVCLWIRTHERLKNAPIVILSGDEGCALYSYNTCQADVFLDKDKSYPEIVAAVNSQLRRTNSARGFTPCPDLTLDWKNLCILRGEKTVLCLSPEQFRFFSMLFERRSRFVGERDMLAYVFSLNPGAGTRDALNMLAHRLRVKLGPQLARRIKYKKNSGWVYVQPRRRNKAPASPQKSASSA